MSDIELAIRVAKARGLIQMSFGYGGREIDAARWVDVDEHTHFILPDGVDSEYIPKSLIYRPDKNVAQAIELAEEAAKSCNRGTFEIGSDIIYPLGEEPTLEYYCGIFEDGGEVVFQYSKTLCGAICLAFIEFVETKNGTATDD